MLTEVCPVVAPDGLDSDRQLNVQRPLEAVPLPRADIRDLRRCQIVGLFCQLTALRVIRFAIRIARMYFGKHLVQAASALR